MEEVEVVSAAEPPSLACSSTSERPRRIVENVNGSSRATWRKTLGSEIAAHSFTI